MIYVARPTGKTIVRIFNVQGITEALFCTGGLKKNFSYGVPRLPSGKVHDADRRVETTGGEPSDDEIGDRGGGARPDRTDVAI
jgi:hypothetical protein